MRDPADILATARAEFSTDPGCAARLDATDPLRAFRDKFVLPTRDDGQPLLYLCGNSLGLMPKSVRPALLQELDDWGRLAVDAHFHGQTPWYSYHETVRDAAARLVGGLPREVVMMNGLSVNLHLLMASFYRPTAQRFAILMEDCAFPSDTYVARTQLRWHDIDPADGLIVVRPRNDARTLETDDIVTSIDAAGDKLALVLLSGVNYYSGQVFDIPTIAAAAHRVGAIAGFDLAHAAGNVPLALHDWNVDFAAWCSYKYLNSGPGSVAGAFIHERHVETVDLAKLPRFGGWWGNDPQTRFRMHLEPEFRPVASADAWQLSNPPILSLAAVRASLQIFDEVGMPALREKAIRLTGYLQYLLDERLGERVQVVTPRAPAARGCQLSILVEGGKDFQQKLQTHGVVGDFRPPNVLRVAPTPLYNTFEEVRRFVEILGELLD